MISREILAIKVQMMFCDCGHSLFFLGNHGKAPKSMGDAPPRRFTSIDRDNACLTQ